MEVTRHREAVRHRYFVPGWGVGEIVVRDRVLVSHSLPSRRSRPGERGQPDHTPGPSPPDGGASTPEFTLADDPAQPGNDFVSDVCRRFESHLRGVQVSYADVTVDDTGLSSFHHDLLHAARTIEWGEVVTYGGLAALAGRPRAARAAGSFCAVNRLSLVVPCHRIVAAGRGEPFELGGYGPSGLALKRRLLGLEGTLL